MIWYALIAVIALVALGIFFIYEGFEYNSTQSLALGILLFVASIPGIINLVGRINQWYIS